MPKIKYIEKRFSNEKLLRIEQINDIIMYYAEQDLRLTLRQAYYQLVAQDMIPNTQQSYKQLGVLVNDARLAGLIDWDAIEDRTRFLRYNEHWETVGGVIESAAYSYHLDHWAGQENYVEVWVEKDALIGIVEQISKKLDVSHFSCRGYVSQSEMWNAAMRIRKRNRDGQNVILLHLGDHDPSGIDMSRDIRDRLNMFGAHGFEFHRLALNMDQINVYDPPPNPAKITDTRAKAYIGKYGRESWELDALDPKVIRDIIGENVAKYRDEKMYQAIVEKEKAGKKMLDSLSDNWQIVERNWEDIEQEYFAG